VLEFAEFLLSRKQIEKLEPKSISEKGPILEYIGGVSHGALAKDIDDGLYV